MSNQLDPYLFVLMLPVGILTLVGSCLLVANVLIIAFKLLALYRSPNMTNMTRPSATESNLLSKQQSQNSTNLFLGVIKEGRGRRGKDEVNRVLKEFRRTNFKGEEWMISWKVEVSEMKVQGMTSTADLSSNSSTECHRDTWAARACDCGRDKDPYRGAEGSSTHPAQ
jgi:hypothetical protein